MNERVIYFSLLTVERRKIKKSACDDRVKSYSNILYPELSENNKKIIFFHEDIKKKAP